MKKTSLAAIAAITLSGFILSGCISQNKGADPSAGPNQDQPQTMTDIRKTPIDAAAGDQTAADPGAAGQPAKSYGLDEISKHASPEDCWLAIKGKVYDVSPFIASGQHNPAIKTGCGKDATRFFTARPGRGTDHPENAYAMLGNFYIGELEQ